MSSLHSGFGISLGVDNWVLWLGLFSSVGDDGRISFDGGSIHGDRIVFLFGAISYFSDSSVFGYDGRFSSTGGFLLILFSESFDDIIGESSLRGSVKVDGLSSSEESNQKNEFHFFILLNYIIRKI